jgi:hypothetical protein
MTTKNILFFISGMIFASILLIAVKSLREPTKSHYLNSVLSGLKEEHPNASFEWVESEEISAVLISNQTGNQLAVTLTNLAKPVFLFNASEDMLSIKTSDDKILTLSFDRKNGTVHTLGITKIEGGSEITFLDRNLRGFFEEKFEFSTVGIRRFFSSNQEWVEVD